MRSKTLVWVYLFVLSMGTIFSLWVPKNEAVAKDSIVIPGDAIRLRILANSDSGSDQALKRKVRDAVNAQIELWVQDLTSKDRAKEVIKANLPKIQAIAEKVVHDEGSTQTVNVKFGIVQFPTKLYGQFLYPAGKYQAVLITLGKGLGANWWCVLFPPLCFLDFSNGVAVSNGFDEQKAEAKTEPASSDDNTYKSKALGAADDSVDQQLGDEAGSSVEPQVDQEEKSAAPLGDQEVAQPQADQVQAADQPVNISSHKVKKQKAAPVYTSDDEQPVQVKFFVVELWHKLFD